MCHTHTHSFSLSHAISINGMNAIQMYDDIERYGMQNANANAIANVCYYITVGAATADATDATAVAITVDFTCTEKNYDAFYRQRFPIYCILEYCATCVHIFPII